jgi:ABC-type antimicrobial peptide transport system permease subunit
MVLRDGAMLASLGVAAGGAVFAGTGRVLGAMLYDVRVLDPLSLVGAAAIATLAALTACYVAAQRTTAVDVMTALRSD